MSFTEHCNEIFNQAIRDYHVTDNVRILSVTHTSILKTE